MKRQPPPGDLPESDPPRTRPVPEAALALSLLARLERRLPGAPRDAAEADAGRADGTIPTLLFVAGDEARLARLEAAARGFGGAGVEVLALPPWDSLPYDRAPPSAAVVGQRVRTLEALARPASRPRLVLTTADACLQRVPPPAAWAGSAMWLETGRPVDLPALRASLAERGYHLAERVDEPGEVAIRGRTIEAFPAGDPAPVRLSLGEDGQIAAIQCYDAETQRSTVAVQRVALHRCVEFPPDPDAAREAAEALARPGAEDEQAAQIAPAASLVLPARLVPLFDYLPAAGILMDPDVERRWQAFAEQVEDAYAATLKAARAGLAPSTLPRPARLYLSPPAARRAVADRLLHAGHAIAPDGTGEAGQASAGELGELGETIEPPERTRDLLALARAAMSRGERVVIAAPDRAAAVSASLARRGLEAPVAGRLQDIAPGTAGVLELDLADGLARPGLLVLPVAALLRRREAAAGGETGRAPRIGELVVHLEHGIARVTGLARIGGEAGAPAEERVVLAFADEAELLVPASELDQVWRYGETRSVGLDRLGGSGWQRRRAEIEAEIGAAARGLAQAAAARDARRAPAIEPPPEAARLARRFAHPLSPGQRAAIADVLADMARGRPMDRLVCGDVGFGKTEVALRALAAAALAGWQVAMVAPTGVLARQHLDSVRRRLDGTGLRVEPLRAATGTAGRAVLRGLASGEIRVVVGTQSLASDSVRFHNLGLVIIDEEQRFGEADKARLAAWGAAAGADGASATGEAADTSPAGPSVHVLTMTATPIPRTLQAALVGLRDVSLIATPPVRRQPTRTFVLPWDGVVAREALLRERRRGGQSFVVVPRIADMAAVGARLAEAVPELSVVPVHGRMPAEALERAVIGFGAGRGDVLLATDIIEAGLDIPRANTLLVLRADRFGLAQLHQLRGRVGRGQRRGSAYLFTEPGARLAPATHHRLRLLEGLSGLGAGVAISAADLDRRGGGELFGARQAGHLGAIGTGLYQHLLAAAAAALRGTPPPPPAPVLHVGLGGYIPEPHVPEPNLRLALYERLARLAEPSEVEAFAEELADRFGPAPEPLDALLTLARLRCLCRRRGVARLDAGPHGVALTPADPAGAERLAEAMGARVRNGRVLLQTADHVRPGAAPGVAAAIGRALEALGSEPPA